MRPRLHNTRLRGGTLKGLTAVLLLAGLIIASVRFCTAQNQPAGDAGETSTDNRSQVKLREMVVTVGAGGQLQGGDDLVLQAGVDYLQKFGGGVLKILPGEYVMRNSLRLPSHITIQGTGQDTVLRKAPSMKTQLARDSDWYESQVEVADATGFTPGCGVLLRAHRGEDQGLAGMKVLKATVTGIEGNTVFIDRRLQKDFWVREDASAATVFSIITAEDAENVRIEDIVLDGNKEQNEGIDGNICGGVYLLRCKSFSFKNVTVRNYNGDGYSLQICDDLSCDNCNSESNARYGFHLGSGSQRALLRNCTARSNTLGIFFCWGVNDAVIENTTCADNSDYGILLGHRDADNKIAHCTIEHNGKAGIIFTQQDAVFDGAHRNTIVDCRIRDNGPDAPGVGIAVEEANEDIVIRNNSFEDTGSGRQKIAIYVSPKVSRTLIDGNHFVNQAAEVDRSISLKERIKDLMGR